MKHFLSCMAVLGFLVGSASAELDLEARRELQNIREGKNDGKAIKVLRVTDEVILPTGSLDAADLAADSVAASEIAAGAVGTSEVADGTLANVDIAANAAIARSKLSLGGVTTTNVIVSGNAKTNTIIAIDGVITSWVITQ